MVARQEPDAAGYTRDLLELRLYRLHDRAIHYGDPARAERDAEVEHQTARDTFGSEKLWAGAANKWRVQAAELATELAHPLQTGAPRSCTNGSINPPDQRPVGRRFRQADIASRRLPLRNELRRALPSVT